MTARSNTRPQPLTFARVLSRRLLGTSACFFVATVCVVTWFTYRSLADAFKVKLMERQRLFTAHIAEDLLTGAAHEVYRKAKEYVTNDDVIALQIDDVRGRVIFSEIRGEQTSYPLASFVFYDEERKELAWTISAQYSTSALHNTFRMSLGVCGGALLLLLAVQWLIVRLVTTRISHPLTMLTTALRANNPDELRNVASNWRENVESPIDEIETVYEGTRRFLMTIDEYQQALIRNERDAAVGRVAAQVAHDIRSPLAALRVVVGQLAEVGEAKRVLIRQAVGRIEDIANDLARRQGRSNVVAGDTALTKVGQDTADTDATGAHGVDLHLLSALIESLVSEKRTQYRGQLGLAIEAGLDATTYGVFARVAAGEFHRVLSNLVNNAVEALAGGGTVTVGMAATAEVVTLTVTDTGAGIPPEIVTQLMQRGATFGKTGGSGLGLYHARTTIESWGGTVMLTSSVDHGTTVTLTLPRAVAPEWFVPRLTVASGTTVVIIDDDASIHQVWTERMDEINAAAHDITLQHFSSGTAVCQWTPSATPAMYWCDYELLGEPANGLDLIERLQVADRAVLVTSRYEEPTVRIRAAQLGVRLVPKGLAGWVPIEITPECDAALSQATAPTGHSLARDAVTDCRVLVIDDDSGIRFAWTIAAEDFGVAELTTYESMEACEAAAPAYAQYDVAFVDKNIPESAWPLDKTLTYLKQAGVRHVVVASGESMAALQADPQCAAADGFVMGKIPEDLNSYLARPDDPSALQTATG